MTYRFRRSGLIEVTCYLRNGGEEVVTRLALDTGAEATVLSTHIGEALGLETLGRTRMYTASEVVVVQMARLDRISALGRELKGFPVRLQALPPALGIHGLLGLDFLRDTRLTLDFRSNLLTIA